MALNIGKLFGRGGTQAETPSGLTADGKVGDATMAATGSGA